MVVQWNEFSFCIRIFLLIFRVWACSNFSIPCIQKVLLNLFCCWVWWFLRCVKSAHGFLQPTQYLIFDLQFEYFNIWETNWSFPPFIILWHPGQVFDLCLDIWNTNVLCFTIRLLHENNKWKEHKWFPKRISFYNGKWIIPFMYFICI